MKKWTADALIVQTAKKIVDNKISSNSPFKKASPNKKACILVSKYIKKSMHSSLKIVNDSTGQEIRDKIHMILL